MLSFVNSVMNTCRSCVTQLITSLVQIRQDANKSPTFGMAINIKIHIDIGNIWPALLPKIIIGVGLFKLLKLVRN
jgi:hypothetical protein